MRHRGKMVWFENLPLSHDFSSASYTVSETDEDEVTMVIQVNGKVRDRISVPAGISAEEAEAAAVAAEKVQSWLEKGEVRKVIARPPKLVNIVVG